MLRVQNLLVACLAIAFVCATPISRVDQNERDPEMNPDLFEGDIIGIKDPKNAVVDTTLLWPNGIIYYKVSNQYSAEELATLQEAFAQYEAKTCLKFVERTTEQNYVLVMKTGGGCYSYIGMIGGVQRLSLDSSCFRCTATGCLPGTPIHEFMHAAGFYHEQSRTDRDDYVTINWSNIQPGMEGNFANYGTDVIQSLGAPYDYGSVMHYGAYGFAVDPTIPTIIVPAGVEIGQRVGFSDTDLFKLNALYGCSKK